MKIASISNLNFTRKNSGKINITKQKVKILNPDSQDPDKILLIMSKNPVIFCTGCESSNIADEVYRGFVHSFYTPLDEE